MIRHWRPGLVAAIGLLSAAFPSLAAQDSLSRIRIGINYTGSGLPPLVVLAGPGLDSIRKIVERDLQFSDRFEVPILADSVARLSTALDSSLIKGLGVPWVVELQPSGSDVEFKVHDVATGKVRLQGKHTLDRGGVGDARLGIHQMSDEVVGAITGDVGIAASRILFKLKNDQGEGIWRMDSDGANLVRVSRPGGVVMTPAWSPDATKVAYTDSRDGVGRIVVQTLATGTTAVVPTTTTGTNYSAEFSPDGRLLVFAKALNNNTDIYSVRIVDMCCGHRLSSTVADSYSPTYSPDGQRIAFVTTRASKNRIYVMDADGTGAEPLVPFDVGSNAYDPTWSPSSGVLAFSADLDGGRQVMTYEIGTGRSRQRTSEGTNENPSWAPDSRHLVVKSKRTGQEQLWVIDLVTGHVRQLLTRGAATYPTWSRSIVPNP